MQTIFKTIGILLIFFLMAAPCFNSEPEPPKAPKDNPPQIESKQSGVCLFKIKFYNLTKEKISYTLDWIDHPYDWPFPFNVAGGELQSETAGTTLNSFSCGKYRITWVLGDLLQTQEFVHNNGELRELQPNVQ